MNMNKLPNSIKFFPERVERYGSMHYYFIYRYFVKVVEYIQQAIKPISNGRLLVNCVFGKSRSTTCVVAYLMLCHGWTPETALVHIRHHRPVQLNYGFIQQLVDLEHKLDSY